MVLNYILFCKYINNRVKIGTIQSKLFNKTYLLSNTKLAKNIC